MANVFTLNLSTHWIIIPYVIYNTQPFLSFSKEYHIWCLYTFWLDAKIYFNWVMNMRFPKYYKTNCETIPKKKKIVCSYIIIKLDLIEKWTLECFYCIENLFLYSNRLTWSIIENKVYIWKYSLLIILHNYPNIFRNNVRTNKTTIIQVHFLSTNKGSWITIRSANFTHDKDIRPITLTRLAYFHCACITIDQFMYTRSLY